MDQEVPASVGRASFRATLRAIPVPLLVTVSVYSSGRRHTSAYGDWSSDVWSSALRTSTEAEAVSDPSLVVVTLAVLSTGEELRSEERRVGKECRAWGAPPAWTEREQLRGPAAMAQVGEVA